MPAKFDVFLSHASPDKPLVEVLGKRLMAENLRPWLDKWNLIPGEPWQPQIELALADCIACAVFIGSGDRGPWHEEELRTAIRRRVERREQAFRVIPVLLPGAKRTELPDFLTATTWVEFRDLDDTEAFDRLLCGIRGIEPGLGKQGAVYEGRNPYRGLELFDVNDAPLFFGRQELTGRLLDALKRDPSGKESRFLAIVGASGSGKSSVARAGLLAALKVGKLEGSQTWPQAICLPGSDPFFNLANAMKGVAQESDRVLVFGHLKERRDGVKSLDQATNLVLGEPPRAERLVLLVDQFEEVFTLCENEADRRDFIAMLLHASKASRGRTIVVLTLRADFYHRCAAHADLAAMLSNHQILFGPMTDSELREAIVSPAQRAGLVPDPGLVQILVDYVVGRVGALPALQFTLQQVWQHREANRLTIGAYNKIGKIEGALGRKADEIYNAFSPEEKDLCRRVFLRLVQPGEGSEDTRRRASLSELVTDDGAQSQAIQAVIAKLTDPNSRLLTTERQQSASGQGTIEVAHEALIRGWPEFRKWIDADRAGIRTHLRLTEAAKEWTEADTDSKKQEALLTGGRLLVASEWAVKHPDELSVLEKNFLSASEEHERQTKADEAEKNRRLAEAEHARAEAERQRAEEAEKREIAEQRRVEDLKKTTLRLTHSVAALVLSLFVVVWLLGRLNDKSKLAEARAAIATSRQLASLSVSERNKRLDRSLILAAEAFRSANTFEARDSLFKAIQKRPGFRSFLHMEEGYVSSVSFSRDGKTFAAGYGDGNGGGGVVLWNAVGRKRLTKEPINVKEGRVVSICFSPDGKKFAAGYGDGHGGGGVVLWDAEVKKRLSEETLIVKEGNLYSVSFSPDSKMLAAGYGRGQGFAGGYGGVVLWDAEERKRLAEEPLTVKEGSVNSISFSPDSRILAAGYDGGIVLWDTAGRNGLTKEEFDVNEGNVSSLSFSPDGNTLAIGYHKDGGGGVVLRDASWKYGLRKEPLAVKEGNVSSVSFSPDGSTLAAGYKNGGIGGVVLWDAPGRKRLAEEPLALEEGEVSSVSFSRDGKTLAAGYGDVKGGGGVVLWDAVGRKRLTKEPITVKKGKVSSVSFSPDSKILAVGYGYGTGNSFGGFVLWDTVERMLLAVEALTPPEDYVSSVSFSPDGKTLAVGYGAHNEIGGFVLWDVERKKRLSGETFTVKEGNVSEVSFSPVGKTLAARYGLREGDGVVLWNAAERKRLVEETLTRKSGMTSMSFSPDGKTLAAGSWFDGVVFWDVDPYSWMRLAGEIANRNLTRKEWREYFPEEKTYHKTFDWLPEPPEDPPVAAPKVK